MQSRRFLILLLALVAGWCCNVTLGQVESSCLTEWEQWTECTATCGTGLQTRSREISMDKLDTCQIEDMVPFATKETQLCNSQVCDVDCMMGEWEEWTECSVECGGGLQGRIRPVLVEPVGNGAECPPAAESRECNLQECDVDCELGEWGDWSDCTQTCDSGEQTRSRDVLVEQSGNGKACEPTTETQECNTDACDADCVMEEWGEWSECSATCGNGHQVRIRGILVEQAGSGAECEAKVDTGFCNMDECPPTCKSWGEWSDWTACDCRSGNKIRFRDSVIEQDESGMACPPDIEKDDCGADECGDI